MENSNLTQEANITPQTNQHLVQEDPKQKGFAFVLIFLVVIVLVVVGVFYWKVSNKAESQTAPSPVAFQPTLPEAKEKLYKSMTFTSPELGISFEYPLETACSDAGGVCPTGLVTTQIGNKIFIHDKMTNPTEKSRLYYNNSNKKLVDVVPHMIEVFQKKNGETMEQTIKREILAGYPDFCVYDSNHIRVSRDLVDTIIDNKYGGDQVNAYSEIGTYEEQCPHQYTDVIRSGAPPVWNFTDSSGDKFIFYMSIDDWYNGPGISQTIKFL